MISGGIGVAAGGTAVSVGTLTVPAVVAGGAITVVGAGITLVGVNQLLEGAGNTANGIFEMVYGFQDNNNPSPLSLLKYDLGPLGIWSPTELLIHATLKKQMGDFWGEVAWAGTTVGAGAISAAGDMLLKNLLQQQAWSSLGIPMVNTGWYSSDVLTDKLVGSITRGGILGKVRDYTLKAWIESLKSSGKNNVPDVCDNDADNDGIPNWADPDWPGYDADKDGKPDNQPPEMQFAGSINQWEKTNDAWLKANPVKWPEPFKWPAPIKW